MVHNSITTQFECTANVWLLRRFLHTNGLECSLVCRRKRVTIKFRMALMTLSNFLIFPVLSRCVKHNLCSSLCPSLCQYVSWLEGSTTNHNQFSPKSYPSVRTMELWKIQTNAHSWRSSMRTPHSRPQFFFNSKTGLWPLNKWHLFACVLLNVIINY